MNENERREALATIIREALRLRDIAKESDSDFLAFLLENVLHEARANLIGAGGAMPTAEEATGSVVVPLKPTSR